MSPQHVARAIRRQGLAVAILLALALGLGYRLEHTNPGYADTGTFSFIAPKSSSNLFAYGQSLLVMDQLAATWMTSDRAHHAVSRAGGAADYDVELVNLNTEDFPNYSDPYLTVTVTAPQAGPAQRTFAAVVSVLHQYVNGIQQRQGASLRDQIQMRQIATSVRPGPVEQDGSKIRVLGGFALLVSVVIVLVATSLDQDPSFLRFVRRPRRAAVGRPADPLRPGAS
jgi:hypothetical protein